MDSERIASIQERAAQVRLLIFDVDGVLTDGSIYVSDHGHEYKAFHSRDGLGMVLLRESGVRLAVITARSSPLVKLRMNDLGITDVYQGRRDKLAAYEELRNSLQLADTQVGYMGDDVIDLPVMRRVGLALTVADAHWRVREQAHWCSELPGGRGAARAACELILAAQGQLERMLERY